MFPCPSCHSGLSRVKTATGFIYCCPACDGRSVAVPVLRRDCANSFVKDLLIAIHQDSTPATRPCPFCARLMKTVSVATPHGPLTLDYCGLCNQVWFDPQEYQSVPQPTPDSEELSPELREALAIYKLKSENEFQLQLPIDEEPADSIWQYLPAAFGLPVELNDEPVTQKPWLTWGLSAAMAFLFVVLYSADALHDSIDEFGFIPNLWYRQAGLTMLTSFFLHAGILHIACNLYFFMVFADNVEDHLGRGKFLLLLGASQLAGLLLHAVADPRPGIPLVGASGAIAGVLAYYALIFPQARVGLFVGYRWVFRWCRISAIWALVLYVGMQLLGACVQRQGVGSVSSFGHLGGLSVGLIAGLWERRRPAEEAA